MVWLWITLLCVIAYSYGLDYLRKKDSQKQQEYENRKPPKNPETEVEKQYNQLKAEIQKMKEDSAVLNNPDTFAKYSKIQRQLIPKEELLEQLEKQYKEEQEQFLNKWKEEQANTEKPQSNAKQLTIWNLLIQVASFIGFWPIYYQINSISMDQLHIFGYMFKEEENHLYIWGPYWLICCNILASVILKKN